eukprot:7321999-Heterocapsa_arctica.AAC.1
MPSAPVPGTPLGGDYYSSSPANSIEGSQDSLPAYLREFRPDEETDIPALCCRLGISGLFIGPDVAINGDKVPSDTSTRFASPASSVADDEEDSDVAPWGIFDKECNIEN